MRLNSGRLYILLGRVSHTELLLGHLPGRCVPVLPALLLIEAAALDITSETKQLSV